MDAGFGRGMEFGVGRPPAAGLIPNGLLPARAGGRGVAPPPGRGPPEAGAPLAGPGRGAGPGRVPGVGGSPPDGRRVVSRCRAACAARTAASCSALRAAARASAAATSMSCALAGLTTGAAGVTGRGGPGTGLRRSPPPDWRLGGGGVGRAAGRAGVPGAAEDFPSAGAGDGLFAAGAGAGADGAADPATKEARRRRATGASTVLDADLTYSPSS
jgi:hypothetical protein